MKNIKVEWCENFIRAAFTKHMPPQLKNPGIEVNYFWTLAEKAGLWVRGTYGSPMSIALDNLCTVESVCDGEGIGCSMLSGWIQRRNEGCSTKNL